MCVDIHSIIPPKVVFSLKFVEFRYVSFVKGLFERLCFLHHVIEADIDFGR